MRLVLQSKQIIVQLRGNLGNQLYQYIAALELVDGDSGRVLLDTRLCKYYGSYALPMVIGEDHLHHATPLDLATVGEIPIRNVGFRTLYALQRRMIDPFSRLKAECGWYGKYRDAYQSRMTGRPAKFISGMFQHLVYYSNARAYITEYALPTSIQLRYDLAVSLRQGRDFEELGLRLGIDYYATAMKSVDWGNVKRIAITGDVLPPWDIRMTFPEGISVDSFVGKDQILQFDILRNAKTHVLANSTFSWWATVFGQSLNPELACYASSNWFTADQLSFIGAMAV